jgi:hypothetical protein
MATTSAATGASVAPAPRRFIAAGPKRGIAAPPAASARTGNAVATQNIEMLLANNNQANQLSYPAQSFREVNENHLAGFVNVDRLCHDVFSSEPTLYRTPACSPGDDSGI